MKTNKLLLKKIRPYIGKIEFFDFNGHRQIASGSMFFYMGRWLIATAAHCVFDIVDKHYNKDFSFYFTFNKKVCIREAYIHKYWVKNEYLEFDIAFLIPEDDKIYENLDKKSIIPSFKIMERQSCFVCGIGLLLSKPRVLYRNVVTDKTYQSNLIGINTHFYSGMSGGPWYQWKNQKFILFATSSLSFKSVQNTLWGVNWNEEIKSIADVAVSDDSNEKVIKLGF
jgi:hypothetical protein